MNPIPTYKVILVGDGGVGKTTFLNRAMNNAFDAKYIPTLGVEVHPIRIGGHEQTHAVFNVWDCAGQEKFAGLRDGYYIQASVAIFAFDLTSHHTFMGLAQRVLEVKRMSGDIPFIVLGMKNDLPRDVSHEKVFQFVHPSKYIEISSKSDADVRHVFETLLGLLE